MAFTAEVLALQADQLHETIAFFKVNGTDRSALPWSGPRTVRPKRRVSRIADLDVPSGKGVHLATGRGGQE